MNPDVLDIANYVGLIIGVIGLLLAFYFRPKPKRLVYRSATITVFGGYESAAPDGQDLAGVSVTYEGRPITRISSTYIAMWNAGRQTITAEAIDDPIRFKVDNGHILRAQVLAQGRSNVEVFMPAESSSEVLVRLSFLNYREGFIVKLLHSGEASVVVTGRIVGISEIKNLGSLDLATIQREGSPRSSLNVVTATTTVILLSSLAAVTALVSRAHISLAASSITLGSLLIAIAGFFTLQRYRRGNIPDSLDAALRASRGGSGGS